MGTMHSNTMHSNFGGTVPLAGSARLKARDATSHRTVLDDDSPVSATLILRRRLPLRVERLRVALTADEFAHSHGADPADVALVTDTLRGLGVDVIEEVAAQRRLRISGTVGLLGWIFGTTLEMVTSRDPDGRRVSHRQRTGILRLPAALDGVVVAVLGLDDRPQAHVQFRVAPSAAVRFSYTPPQLGEIYEFPSPATGAGQMIALIELGGGYSPADVDAYFSSLGLATPAITSVGIDGTENQPGKNPNGTDVEVLLDIEVAGALAPGAALTVYFAPNTDAGFVDAVSQAAHATPTPTAISISWGQSEDDWTQQARTALDEALADAVALGATVTVAAGDNGSADQSTDGRAHVDFPASSPHALSCGGTTLDADATSGAIYSETVWNDGPAQGVTGGGVSDRFDLPAWQARAGVPTVNGFRGRGVPDVAADADPETGYWVRVDGRELTIGGTSAAAPFWAALIARLVEAAGPLSPVLPKFYGLAAAGGPPNGFRDITSGDNGAYRAEPGWDACTGLGVPNGIALLKAVQTTR